MNIKLINILSFLNVCMVWTECYINMIWLPEHNITEHKKSKHNITEYNITEQNITAHNITGHDLT